MIHIHRSGEDVGVGKSTKAGRQEAGDGRPADATPSDETAPAGGRRVSTALRYLGAVLIAVVGALHLQQYFEVIRFVPTVAELFLLNTAAAAIIAATLLTRFRQIGAIVGIGFSLGSIAALAIARYGILFGYSEPTLRTPVAVSLAAEAAAATVLAAYLVQRRQLRRA